MKRVFLGLLMLALTNTPLAFAKEDKAKQVLFRVIAAKCAVEQGMLHPEGGANFFAYPNALAIKRGETTIEEINQITNEMSFQILVEDKIRALGGCREAAHSAKPLVLRYIKWLDRN